MFFRMWARRKQTVLVLCCLAICRSFPTSLDSDGNNTSVTTFALAAPCSTATDCNGHASGVSGTSPGNCACNCFSGYNSTGNCNACLENYVGASCQNRTCHLNHDCNGQGTSFYHNAYPVCGCNCRSGYSGQRCECQDCQIGDVTCSAPGSIGTVSGCQSSCYCDCRRNYVGTDCSTRICHVQDDCNGRGTGITGTYPSCVCTCPANYIGNSCQTRICHKDFDCSGRGLNISGTFPNCSCLCPVNYVGNKCETRICHRTTECRNRGAVNGTFPSCTCACDKGYAGRSCRTATPTTSLSASPTPSHTATATATTTWTATRTGPSATRTRTPTPTATRPSFTASQRSPSRTATQTLSLSATATPLQTPSETATATLTPRTPTWTPPASRSPTTTHTRSPGTRTPTRRATASWTCPVDIITARGGGAPAGQEETAAGARDVREVTPVVEHAVRSEDVASGAAFARLRIREGLVFKGVDVLNISAELVALGAPPAAWQPRGLRLLGPLAGFVDLYGNGSVVVRAAALPQLSIDAPELWHVLVAANAAFGCGGDRVWLALGRVRVLPPPSPVAGLVTGVTGAGALAGDSVDLQGMVIIGLMPCASGEARRLALGSPSSISPLAFLGGPGSDLSRITAGNMVGLAAAAVAVAGGSAAGSVYLRDAHRPDDASGLLRALSACMAPTVLINVLVALYPGSLAASLLALSTVGGTSLSGAALPAEGPADVAAPVCLLLLCAALPLALVAVSRRHATRLLRPLDYRVSIAGPSTQTADLAHAALLEVYGLEALPVRGVAVRAAVRWALPVGVLQPREVGRMFGPAVGFAVAPACPPPPPGTAEPLPLRQRLVRRATHHHLWPVHPLASAWLIALGTLVPARDAAGCQALFAALAALHVLLAAVVLAALPHLPAAKSVLRAAGLATNALAMAVTAATGSNAGSDALRLASRALVGLQLVVGTLQVLLTAGGILWPLWARAALARGWLRAPPAHTLDAGEDAEPLWTWTATAWCVVAWLRQLRPPTCAGLAASLRRCLPGAASATPDGSSQMTLLRGAFGEDSGGLEMGQLLLSPDTSSLDGGDTSGGDLDGDGENRPQVPRIVVTTGNDDEDTDAAAAANPSKDASTDRDNGGVKVEEEAKRERVARAKQRWSGTLDDRLRAAVRRQSMAVTTHHADLRRHQRLYGSDPLAASLGGNTPSNESFHRSIALSNTSFVEPFSFGASFASKPVTAPRLSPAMLAEKAGGPLDDSLSDIDLDAGE